jgi:glutaredoxin
MASRRLRCALLMALTAAAVPAWALYKVVGPDGKVTYTDRPPAEGRAAPLKAPAASGAGLSDAALPFALRELVARFPVTLYSAPDCDPCDRGRALLKQRGVPFRERTATTNADRAAWQRMMGSLQAPVLTIGGQTLRGFSSDTWTTYLDTAGYPKQSQLPAGYAAPAPEPLTPAETAPAAADSPRTRGPATAPPPVPPAADPTTGIRF